jgi:molecular chaperone DnaJ
VADYYETLGVSRDATQDDIKRAFRRKARETHPDANPDDPQAQHDFREAAQAYEVLSDPQKRAAYDRGAQVDFGDLFSSVAGIDDLLARFFGAGGFQFGARSGPAAGEDIGASVEMTLGEVASGASRTVEYRARVTCSTCRGSGAAPDTPLISCDRCAGRGSLRVSRQTFLGTAVSVTTCDKCRGRGRVPQEACPQCRSVGSVIDGVSLAVEIPAGMENGSRLRVSGRGGAGEPGGRPGDLFLEVRVAPDERFERHGADLVHRVRVGFAEAALGATLKVPTVDGEQLEVEVPAGTQPGTVFKLARLGLPHLRRRGRGDMLVEVQVVVPSHLTSSQEEALRAFAAASGEETPDSKRPRRHRR